MLLLEVFDLVEHDNKGSSVLKGIICVFQCDLQIILINVMHVSHLFGTNLNKGTCHISLCLNQSITHTDDKDANKNPFDARSFHNPFVDNIIFSFNCTIFIFFLLFVFFALLGLLFFKRSLVKS
jgi:hypothetical protein